MSGSPVPAPLEIRAPIEGRAPANIDQNGELVYGQFLVSGFFDHGHGAENYYVDTTQEALAIARSMLERGLERVMVEDVFALRANAEAASL